MLQNGTFEYMVKMRRQLHQYPEIGFDLPKTLAMVKGELDALQIPYTEEFGKSSIVATINPECKGFTIGIRGDMDALPMQEANDVPYCSKIPGQMHACGHDAHTAILLGMARELKTRETELTCRVKLLFTPAEEYIEPGCKQMAENGVMDDIDCAVACHVLPDIPAGQIKTRSGGLNANSMGFTVEFFGQSVHGSEPARGVDAIAMAVEAYTAMKFMMSNEFPSKERRVLNVGTFQGGITNNIVCDYCKMFCSSRTHSDAVTEKIIERTRQICDGIAAIHGGQAKVTVNKLLPYVINNPAVTEKLAESAAKVVGAEKILPRERGMGGEDFAFLSRKKPCVMFNLGCMREARPYYPVHNVNFDLDERCLEVGAKIFLQFVLDNMNGFEME